MPSSAATRPAGAGDVAGPEAELVDDDEDDADEAQAQAQPLPAGDPLAEIEGRDGRRQQRLQADDQGGDAGGHAVGDGGEHAAQIDPVDHQPGRHGAADLPGILRPGSADHHRGNGQDRRDADEADQEEGERLGMREAELGADEAGAPEHDERRRHECQPRRARIAGRFFRRSLPRVHRYSLMSDRSYA